MLRFVEVLLIPAMLIGLAGGAFAQERTVLGQGNLACSDWSVRRGEENLASVDTMTAWLLGYLTAASEHRSSAVTDVSSARTTEELAVWIDEYCNENRSSSLRQAASALVESSGPAVGR